VVAKEISKKLKTKMNSASEHSGTSIVYYTRGQSLSSPTKSHTLSTNNVISGKELRVSDLPSAAARVT
jgi:hypothetical protein